MIKIMTVDDYDCVFDLWESIPNLGLRSLDDSKEGISRFLKRNPTTNFVAYKNNLLVGAILSGHDGRRGYIYHTVVRLEYRKQGIGTELVKAAIGALQNEGITRVCLNIMESNEDGKAFWRNQGWDKKDFLGFYSKSITTRENIPFFKT